MSCLYFPHLFSSVFLYLASDGATGLNVGTTNVLRAQDRIMKVLIHNTVTGLYLAEGCRWVKEIADAQDFERAPAAILHAGDLGLTNIEVTYAFPNKKDNITIPLIGFDESPRQNTLDG